MKNKGVCLMDSKRFSKNEYFNFMSALHVVYNNLEMNTLH